MPPNWSIYFLVDDVDAAVARVRELGGQVHNGPFPIGDMDTAAVVADPQGSVFTLVHYAEEFIPAPPSA